MSVDFPAPLSPTRASTSGRPTSRSTPSSADHRPEGLANAAKQQRDSPTSGMVGGFIRITLKSRRRLHPDVRHLAGARGRCIDRLSGLEARLFDLTPSFLAIRLHDLADTIGVMKIGADRPAVDDRFEEVRNLDDLGLGKSYAERGNRPQMLAVGMGRAGVDSPKSALRLGPSAR